MARTKQEWFLTIKNDLAVHSAFVPLEEADLEVALSEALDIWNQYLPVQEYRSVDMPNGLYVIDFSDEEDVYGVGNLSWTDSTVDINRTLTPFYPIQIMSMSIQGPRFQFEVNQTIERWARLLGGKEDYKWVPEESMLYLWNPRGQAHCTFCLHKKTDTDFIPPYRYALFRKLFRSFARKQMVQIFNRLGPIPGPEGAIETDMSYQSDMAAKELEEVIPVLERQPEAMVTPRWD